MILNQNNSRFDSFKLKTNSGLMVLNQNNSQGSNFIEILDSLQDSGEFTVERVCLQIVPEINEYYDVAITIITRFVI